MNRLSVARVLIIAIFVIGGGVSGADKIGRPVTVVSIGFHGKTLEEVTELVNREGAKGADIIALPETFLGQKQNRPETLGGPTVAAMSELARKHGTYIVCPLDRRAGNKRYNSAVLIDRQGKVAAVYDKIYPFWSEFDLNPPVDVGDRAVSADFVIWFPFGTRTRVTRFEISLTSDWVLISKQSWAMNFLGTAFCATRSGLSRVRSGMSTRATSTVAFSYDRANCFSRVWSTII